MHVATQAFVAKPGGSQVPATGSVGRPQQGNDVVVGLRVLFGP